MKDYGKGYLGKKKQPLMEYTHQFYRPQYEGMFFILLIMRPNWQWEWASMWYQPCYLIWGCDKGLWCKPTWRWQGYWLCGRSQQCVCVGLRKETHAPRLCSISVSCRAWLMRGKKGRKSRRQQDQGTQMQFIDKPHSTAFIQTYSASNNDSLSCKELLWF